MSGQNDTSGEAEKDKNPKPAEKPVDQEAQEEAATERKETGGYQ